MVDFVNFVWQRFLESKCQRQRWMIWEAMCLSPRFLDFLVLGFYFGHFDMLCSAMHDVWGMTACMMLNLWLCGWPQKIQSNRIIKELVTGKLVTIRLLDYDYYLMVIRFQFVNSQQLQGLVYLQLYKTVLSPENKKYAVMQSWSQRLKEIIRNHLESFVRRIYLNKIHTIRFHFRILEIQKTPPTTHPPELPPSTTLTCWRLASAAVSFKPMSLSPLAPCTMSDTRRNQLNFNCHAKNLKATEHWVDTKVEAPQAMKNVQPQSGTWYWSCLAMTGTRFP